MRNNQERIHNDTVEKIIENHINDSYTLVVYTNLYLLTDNEAINISLFSNEIIKKNIKLPAYSDIEVLKKLAEHIDNLLSALVDKFNDDTQYEYDKEEVIVNNTDDFTADILHTSSSNVTVEA
jgi:hypothetical protein